VSGGSLIANPCDVRLYIRPTPACPGFDQAEKRKDKNKFAKDPLLHLSFGYVPPK